MEDLMHSQICCKIAMPEGLKELMSDISREVLRSQPADIYNFITKYLAALLVTRENLSIASQIYSHVCDSVCEPELEDELRYIGFGDEDAKSACAMIKEYFEDGGVNESNLLSTLMLKTGMEQGQLPALQKAVRRAFIRNQVNNTVIYEAAYRAYGIRRWCSKKHASDNQNDTKNIRFHETVVCNLDESSASDVTPTETVKGEKPVTSNFAGIRTVSSASLAGSHLSLPTYKPYSIHSPREDLDEIPEKEEKEHVLIDYITEEFKIDRENVGYDKEFKDITELEEDSGNVSADKQ